MARLQPEADLRICEITGPAAWVDLVERYPLEVGVSRSQSWRQVAGYGSRWFMPDWAGVAEDYDAAHLTVLAYLATSGRPRSRSRWNHLLAG